MTDVGLNGVLITENQDHCNFVLQALPNAEPMERPIVVAGHIETRAGDQQTDYAAETILLKVAAKQ